MSTQAQEPSKRSWWTEEDKTLGPMARLVDWVRWHRILTIVIILALAAVIAGIVNMTTGGLSGNAEACSDYYNAQNFAADGDNADAGSQISSIFDEAPRITSSALSQAVRSFEDDQQEGRLTATSYSNQAVAKACVSLGLGNSASN